MALRDSKLFRAIGYTMFGLLLASFVLAVVVRVADGQGAEIYHGGRGLPIASIAARVTSVAIVFGLRYLAISSGMAQVASSDDPQE